jgi:hypothetical protein
MSRAMSARTKMHILNYVTTSMQLGDVMHNAKEGSAGLIALCSTEDAGERVRCAVLLRHECARRRFAADPRRAYKTSILLRGPPGKQK